MQSASTLEEEWDWVKDKQSNQTAGTATSNDNERKVSSSSSSSSSSADRGMNNAGGSRSMFDEPVEDEEPTNANLTPEYNISDVRKALNTIKQQVHTSMFPSLQSEPTAETIIANALLTVLQTLSKITSNIVTHPDEEKYRKLNLANEALKKKLGSHSGTVDYLQFLGFIDLNGDQVLTMTRAQVDGRKLERALSILNRFLVENTPSAAEVESRSLGPIDRDMHVLPLDLSTVNARLGAPDEEFDSETMNDMALIIASASETRQKLALDTRTDVIVTKAKREQLKHSTRRKYTKTLVRLLFPDDQIMITAYFRPWETTETLFNFIAAHLQQNQIGFHFRIPPNLKLTSADQDRTFQSYGLVPAVNIYFHFDSMKSSAGCLKREVYEMKDLSGFKPTVPIADNAEALERARQAEIKKAKFEAQLKAREAAMGLHEEEEEVDMSRLSRTNNKSAVKKTPAWLKR